MSVEGDRKAFAGPINKHSLHSSYREKTLEHIFIGDCLRRLWARGVLDTEVLRADVDAAGYDIVMEVSRVLRHIQLKASYNGSKVYQQKINAKLADKQSGCVVWIGFDPDTLDLGPFYWFGGKPGLPLPSMSGFKKAKHTKANATGYKGERRNSYILKRSSCERLTNLDDVLDRLFG
jgi:hypothetical protein